ncbi:MAG: lysostaphin resistance A-like protein [Phycisphaerae bacterium]
MASSRRLRKRKKDAALLRGLWRLYWRATPQPLYCLLFLFPLIAAYEFGSLMIRPLLAPEQRLVAQGLVQSILGWFGVTGLMLPGIILLLTLLIWHVLNRQAWQVRAWILPAMLVESVVLAGPLFVLNTVLLQARAPETGSSLASAGAPGETGAGGASPGLARGAAQAESAAPAAIGEPLALDDASDGLASNGAREWAPLNVQLIMALGAAIYEEMFFRLILIAGLTFVASDLLRVPGRWAAPLAVTLAASAFALCHFQPVGSDPLVWTKLMMLLAAGVYLSLIYLERGLALAIGCHAAYNLALVLL